MSHDDWRYDALGWHFRDTDLDETPIAHALVAEPPMPRHATSPVAPRINNALGLDVSNWQGTAINWQQVASNYKFCYIKSSEGTNYVSPALDSQWNGARSAGILCGAYHFGTPTNAPEADADAFSAQVNRLHAVQGCLPPCLDLETGTGDLSTWASRFITRLRANTGCVRVMIYSSASFFANQIREDWCDANVALWIASWNNSPGKPSYNTPRVAIHQHSDAGVVSGISGKVDLDYAIWDINTIVPDIAQPPSPPPASNNGASQVSVLTPDEQSRLTACYQQLSGSLTPGQWQGWPTWAGGTNESLTLVDYSRRSNQQLVALQAGLDAARSEIATLKASGVPSVATLSDQDVARIASAVAAMLAQKLAG